MGFWDDGFEFFLYFLMQLHFELEYHNFRYEIISNLANQTKIFLYFVSSNAIELETWTRKYNSQEGNLVTGNSPPPVTIMFEDFMD